MKTELEKDIEQRVSESINKNLPQEVGNVLKDRLLKADEDAKDLDDSRKELETLKKRLTDQEKRINELIALKNSKEKVNAERMALEKMRDSLDMERMKYKLQESINRNEFFGNILNSLARNTELRKSVFGNENKAYTYADNGNCTGGGDSNYNHEETTTQE